MSQVTSKLFACDVPASKGNSRIGSVYEGIRTAEAVLEQFGQFVPTLQGVVFVF